MLVEFVFSMLVGGTGLPAASGQTTLGLTRVVSKSALGWSVEDSPFFIGPDDLCEPKTIQELAEEQRAFERGWAHEGSVDSDFV